MSTLEKDGLKDCLFSGQDNKLLDIKFFRGDKEIIAPDEIAAQVCAIARQRKAGLKPAAGPARSGKDRVNVRKLVASM